MFFFFLSLLLRSVRIARSGPLRGSFARGRGRSCRRHRRASACAITVADIAGGLGYGDQWQLHRRLHPGGPAQGNERRARAAVRRPCAGQPRNGDECPSGQSNRRNTRVPAANRRELLRRREAGRATAGATVAARDPGTGPLGQRDRIIPSAQASDLPKNVAVRMIEQAGHMVHMERAEEANELLCRFIHSS